MAILIRVTDHGRLKDGSQSPFERRCKLLSLHREIAEWLKEHAWKTKRASDTKRFRSTLTHTRSATSPSKTINRCASVNLDVLRGFRLTYHSPLTSL